MKRTISLALVALTMMAPAFAAGGPGNCSLPALLAELPYEEVSAAEETDLLLMREEEKLARDAYMALDDWWGLRLFGQIATSEQHHMDLVLVAFEKYGIPDPVGGNPPGVFTDAQLQQLYDQLVQQGTQSLVDALIVGATIEDLDIEDLFGTLDRADNQDLRTIYQNLQKGSRNHLRSFVGSLEANDATYEPQFLTVPVFEEILSTPREHGAVDADGEPLDCSGGGGNGPGPGGKARWRHQNNNQQNTNSQFGAR
jgi:hypothetical protein